MTTGAACGRVCFEDVTYEECVYIRDCWADTWVEGAYCSDLSCPEPVPAMPLVGLLLLALVLAKYGSRVVHRLLA